MTRRLALTEALADALLALTDPHVRRKMAPPRGNAPSATQRGAHCRALVAAIEQRRGVTHP